MKKTVGFWLQKIANIKPVFKRMRGHKMLANTHTNEPTRMMMKLKKLKLGGKDK